MSKLSTSGVSSANKASWAEDKLDEGRSSKWRVWERTFDRRGKSETPASRMEREEESRAVEVWRDERAPWREVVMIINRGSGLSVWHLNS